MKNEFGSVDIAITKGKITSISFDELDKDLPEVSVTLTLMTANGAPVTNVALSTRSWTAENLRLSKEDIPAHVYSAIGTALRELSSACVRKVNSINKQLAAASSVDF
jgi:hypothetical protein